MLAKLVRRLTRIGRAELAAELRSMFADDKSFKRALSVNPNNAVDFGMRAVKWTVWQINKRAIWPSASALRPLWWPTRRALRILSHDDRKLDTYNGIHKSKACFIIGNGPSLRADDLERIRQKGFICFGANKITRIYGKTSWRPDYYVCIDNLVLTQNIHEILLRVDCPIFLDSRRKKMIKDFESVIGRRLRNIHFLGYRVCKNNEAFVPSGHLLFSGGTVTFTAIELAWMMGFRTFYLIGCDHTYGAYRNIKKTARTLTADINTNEDYFAANYMRRGEIMNVGDMDKATEGYMSAREYIMRHGGRIFNATRGGLLEVFERVDIEAVLNGCEAHAIKLTSPRQ
jgi:hypothetical protein